MSAYKVLLNIAVRHSFYTKGSCSCLNFHPTEETRHIFENAGLLQKKTPDGIQIVYDEDRLEALKLYAEDLEQPLCFVFKVYSSDAEFTAYTEPFADLEGGVLYFDNRGSAAATGETGLSVREYASTSDLKKHASTELEAVLDRKDRLLPPLFVVRLFARTESVSHIEQWLKPEPSSYLIVFKARQTLWKYYLLGRMARESAYITDVDRRIEFEALGQTVLSDRRTALAFRSKQSIPLNENYDFRFQLKEKGPGGENVLINRLPVAGVMQTGTEIVKEQRMMVSEIYINS